MNKIKSYLKCHPGILDYIAGMYSILFVLRNLSLIIRGKLKIRGAFIKNVKVCVRGNNSCIKIGRKARLKDCKIYLEGEKTVITIGGGKTTIHNTDFHVADNNSSIIINDNFTMEGGHIASTEGRSIEIGNDCMFSNNIEIRNGDSHSIILMETNQRINIAKNIIIGNHVWLCANTKVMKGALIPDNCIIGNMSLVTGCFETINSIYAGIPAKKIKQGINWERERF